MIFLDNRQDKIQVTEEMKKVVLDVIEYALQVEKVSIDSEVSVVFIDNSEIKEINKEFRNIDRETDVLSFPMLEYPEHKVYKEVYIGYPFDDSFFNEDRLVLGDIALSLEKVKEQSEEFGHSFLRELSYLTIHSVLHLLGYDHIEELDKLSMRKREEEILENFNLLR